MFIMKCVYTGGPIIMTQIENEFGNYGYTDYVRDKVILFSNATYI